MNLASWTRLWLYAGVAMQAAIAGCVARKLNAESQVKDLSVKAIHEGFIYLLFQDPESSSKICGCLVSNIVSSDQPKELNKERSQCQAPVDRARDCLPASLFAEFLESGFRAEKSPESRKQALDSCKAELKAALEIVDSLENSSPPEGFEPVAATTLGIHKKNAERLAQECQSKVSLEKRRPLTDAIIRQTANEIQLMIRSQAISVSIHNIKDSDDSSDPYLWNYKSQITLWAYLNARAAHQKGRDNENEEPLSAALLGRSFRFKIEFAKLSLQPASQLILYRTEKDAANRPYQREQIFASITKTNDPLKFLIPPGNSPWHNEKMELNSLESGGPACTVGLINAMQSQSRELVQISGEYEYQSSPIDGGTGNTAFVIQNIRDGAYPEELIVQCGFVERIIFKKPQLSPNKNPVVDVVVLKPKTSLGDREIEFKLGHLMALFADFLLVNDTKPKE